MSKIKVTRRQWVRATICEEETFYLTEDELVEMEASDPSGWLDGCEASDYDTEVVELHETERTEISW